MLTDDHVPLPQPVRMSSDQAYLGYTAEQMREHARAVERGAYERAAKECKRRWKGGYPQEVVDDCAAAIRALGRQHA